MWPSQHLFCRVCGAGLCMGAGTYTACRQWAGMHTGPEAGQAGKEGREWDKARPVLTVVSRLLLGSGGFIQGGKPQ